MITFDNSCLVTFGQNGAVPNCFGHKYSISSEINLQKVIFHLSWWAAAHVVSLAVCLLSENVKQNFIVAPTVATFVQMVLDQRHKGNGRSFINRSQFRILI